MFRYEHISPWHDQAVCSIPSAIHSHLRWCCDHLRSHLDYMLFHATKHQVMHFPEGFLQLPQFQYSYWHINLQCMSPQWLRFSLLSAILGLILPSLRFPTSFPPFLPHLSSTLLRSLRFLLVALSSLRPKSYSILSFHWEPSLELLSFYSLFTSPQCNSQRNFVKSSAFLLISHWIFLLSLTSIIHSWY